MGIRPRTSLLNPDLTRPSALLSVPRNGNLIWLDKNENRDLELIEELHKLFHEMSPVYLSTYPEAKATYEKISRWVGVSPESLILTPGSDGAIRLVFEAFVGEKDHVIHTSPTFAMYPVYCQMFGAVQKTIEYERIDDKPFLDIEKILASIREVKPKLLCLPNPDSPTGTVIDSGLLIKILKECEKTDTVFLIDEAYHPFYNWTAVPWIKESPNLIVARTFAKAWGVAGLRIGYAVGQPDTIRYLHKMRPMYEVSTIAVEYISKLLDKPEIMERSVARILEGKEFFLNEMRQLGFKVLSTHGNFIHVGFGNKAEKIHYSLSDKVYYRSSFKENCLRGYSRFSVAPKSVMEKIVNWISESL
ncbi:MAG: histidinol-phosphate aminotransferase family protein [Leptospiraceae bacterium]|nr:histidinol-phosphate aminotransferase family protein [Leptospiraceae bacterium]